MVLNIEVVEKTPLSLKLLVKGVSLHTLNSIRRAIMSEVPTMSIDYVVFIENSSVFYDEYIAHRLGLLPLTSDYALEKYKPPEECAEAGEKGVFSADCYAKFDLDVEGPENGVLTVYAGSLIPSDPDVVPVYPKTLLFKLIKGQRVKLEAFARLGRGREHAKWSPVSVATHKYIPSIKIDPSKCTGCGKCIDACPREVFELTGGKATLKRDKIYDCILCNLCEQVCEQNAIKVLHVEGEYILYLEFTGALSPVKTLVEASNILLKKLNELEEKLRNLGVIQ